MKVLVTGAAGFIGSAIVERLIASGHAVVACVRGKAGRSASGRLDFCPVDLNLLQSARDWLPYLDGIDAVVNAAGILREHRAGDFERIHHQSPLALARACAEKGIGRFVQISALGHVDDGEFVASKHRFDRALLSTDELDAIVLRPSVVVSLRGSYGGTSMLRAMAALPVLLCLPGDGSQKIQPIWLDDLTEMVEQALSQPPGVSTLLEAVGPEIVTLRTYLLATRHWLKLPAPLLELKVPMPVVGLLSTVGDLPRSL